jgi:copper chaperone CopZ
MLIEGELEDVGVTAKANYAKQTVEVTFDEKKTDLSTIQKTIGKIGYRVTGIVS